MSFELNESELKELREIISKKIPGSDPTDEELQTVGLELVRGMEILYGIK